MFSGVNELLASIFVKILLWRLIYVNLLLIAQLLKFSRISLVRELM